jgi:hypothetical protein
MPLSTDQLRELLAERSDAADLHPAPQEDLSMRIRRARIRRATVAGLLAVVAAAGVLTGLHLSQDHAASAVPVSGRQFPVSFTASDGTVYRRVAVTSMAAGQRSATIDVTVGTHPVDVMASCAAPGQDLALGVDVDGASVGFATCPGTPQLVGLPARPGRQAAITFVSEARSVTTRWQFAVYEWIPPAAVAMPALAVPRLPGSYTGDNTADGVTTTRLSLVASRSGQWPADRTVTITVPDHGRYFAVSLACSGDIAGRLQVSVLDRGQLTDLVTCASWTPGQQPPGQITFGGRAGAPDTLTFRIQAPSSYWAADYAKRPASWTIAIYQEGASVPAK